jgi:hypothetical protein
LAWNDKMRRTKRRSSARRRTCAVAAPVVLAVALASGSLLAGNLASIRGKVAGWDKLIPQVYAEAAKPDAHRYNWREPSPTVKQDFRRLSATVSHEICVAAFGKETAQPHEAIAVKVTGGRLSPSTIALSVGSRISFRNFDPFPHVLYEVGNDKWGPNPSGPSSTREWAATAPGVHVIRDQLFPSVIMYIVVDPAAVEYAVPDRDGAFSITLSPGEYTLKAFFDGKQVGKDVDNVRVGERGFEIKEPIALGGESK